MFLLKYFYKKIGVIIRGDVYIILQCGWGIFSKTTVVTFLFFKCSYPNPPSKNYHLKIPTYTIYIIYLFSSHNKAPKHQSTKAPKQKKEQQKVTLFKTILF